MVLQQRLFPHSPLKVGTFKSLVERDEASQIGNWSCWFYFVCPLCFRPTIFRLITAKSNNKTGVHLGFEKCWKTYSSFLGTLLNILSQIGSKV